MPIPPPMPVPPLHPQEAERLVSVCGLEILNTGRSPTFDLAARQAAALCAAPMGLVTLLDESNQIFLGREGIEGAGTPRDEAFCAYTVLQAEPLIVEDALQDPRFAQHPAVLGTPFIRFYAGVPFTDRFGLPLGSVCVADHVPRALSIRRVLVLQRLAAVVGVILDARRALVELLGVRSEALPTAVRRLEETMDPLFGRANGFSV